MIVSDSAKIRACTNAQCKCTGTHFSRDSCKCYTKQLANGEVDTTSMRIPDPNFFHALSSKDSKIHLMKPTSWHVKYWLSYISLHLSAFTEQCWWNLESGDLMEVVFSLSFFLIVPRSSVPCHKMNAVAITALRQLVVCMLQEQGRRQFATTEMTLCSFVTVCLPIPVCSAAL